MWHYIKLNASPAVKRKRVQMKIVSFNAANVGSSWIVSTLATVNGKAIIKHISAETVRYLQKHRRIEVSGLVAHMAAILKAIKSFFACGEIRKRKIKRMEGRSAILVSQNEIQMHSRAQFILLTCETIS